ncbi:MAG: LysR family transcriptional regulator, partial [Rhodospirillales bacterium]
MDAGSIAAASRRMNMSYKRAWYLVKSINISFGKPLVVMQKGGRSGGSAVLTPLGKEVLMRYRRMEKLTAKAIDGEIKALKTTLNKKSGR